MRIRSVVAIYGLLLPLLGCSSTGETSPTIESAQCERLHECLGPLNSSHAKCTYYGVEDGVFICVNDCASLTPKHRSGTASCSDAHYQQCVTAIHQLPCDYDLVNAPEDVPSCSGC